ncbi:MAG TPA: hydrogenase nickel incorporation protein HypB [Holophaga sp.]|nr:hydrogenase nickel incorporation protein HypB [Holophaga sp.]
MCTTCGCGGDGARIEGTEMHAHDHPHPHPHRVGLLRGARRHGQAHHEHGESRMIQLEQDLLAKNDAFAAENRALWQEQGIFVLNLVSSPGSGKTTLLTATIDRLKEHLRIAVIEGDQQTSVDADRIRATGAPAIQVNTGKGCHLDAHMVGHAAQQLGLEEDSVLMVENVGNLVCPAGFDLGEAHKVVILSVTEGEDKPFKYPDMFAAADVMILNKVDLLPYVKFDVDACLAHALKVNPKLLVLKLSATTGENLEAWTGWIEAGVRGMRGQKQETIAGLKQRIAELEAQLGKA